jgi:hypothetical protein
MGLTFPPVSAILSSMPSLLQTRFGMFSARADRGRPGAAEKRFLINQNAPRRKPSGAALRGVLQEPPLYFTLVSQQ